MLRKLMLGNEGRERCKNTVISYHDAFGWHFQDMDVGIGDLLLEVVFVSGIRHCRRYRSMWKIRVKYLQTTRFPPLRRWDAHVWESKCRIDSAQQIF